MKPHTGLFERRSGLMVVIGAHRAIVDVVANIGDH